MPVFRAIVKVQRWWVHSPTAPGTDRERFEIACLCGQRHAGWRQATHQVIACVACRRRLFVLPSSPLPRLAADLPPPVLPAFRQKNPWRGPLVGASVTLFCMVGIFAIVLGFLLPRRAADLPPSIVRDRVEAEIAAGQKSLGDGDFARAVQAFDAALEMIGRNPAILPPKRARQVAQLRRQAGLMADWPGERLELDLARAAVLGDQDWQTLANLRRGRTLIFDGILRRDATGQLRVNRPPPVVGQTFRIPLSDLKLLKPLPLNEPTRVIFLARVARLQRQAPDVYAIDLDADSGALLTDKRVAKRCGYAILDPEVEGVLERQTHWVAELFAE